MALEIELWANNASTTLAAPAAPSDTTITVASAAAFPTPTGNEFFRVTLNDAATGLITEIVGVSNVTGNVFTVVRALEGTTAKSWASNDLVNNFVTAGALANLGQLTYLQTFGFLVATDTGAADAYVGTLAPVPLALSSVRNAPIMIAVANTNSGGAATLNLNGLGAQPIHTRSGGNPGAGLLTAGVPAILSWDGTAFIVLSS